MPSLLPGRQVAPLPAHLVLFSLVYTFTWSATQKNLTEKRCSFS